LQVLLLLLLLLLKLLRQRSVLPSMDRGGLQRELTAKAKLRKPP